MVANAGNTSATADREIRTSRTYDAPRELVWKAWSSPEHLDQWWGPDGFTTTTHEFDLRAGGVWRFTMHGPDGTDFPNVTNFLEVTPPERLVYDHGDGEGGRSFHVTVTFEEQGGKTLLTMVALFPTAEARDYVVREVGAVEGANQTLNRLAAYLATM